MRLALGVILATVLSYPLGLAVGSPWALPLLNALPAYAVMAWLLVRGRRREAVGIMLVWAAVLAVTGTVAFAAWPAAPDGLVLNGPAYRDEMFEWFRTGQGRESSPGRFLPQHALHLAGFALLSLVTASALSIAMGAALMNYMSFYVASLAQAGLPAGTVVLFGWQPWAICRVAAFSILGVVLAEPLLSRIRPYPYEGLRSARRWLYAAGVLLLADIALKTALAPLWGEVLRAAPPR